METAPKIESISLSPQEKALYEKCLGIYPGMTIMSWKELRKDALNSQDAGAKMFYEINGLLIEEKPDEDNIKELSPKNFN